MSSRPSSSRRAFTLVEMLVVLGIIGILIGLLLPAIMMAVNNARRATISAEISQLDGAFEAYKMAKGEYPPSFGERNSSGNLIYNITMGTPNRYTSVVERHLQRAYPKFRDNTSVNNDVKDLFYQNTMTNQDAMHIDQGEALVMWLRLTASNPANPFDQVSSRVSYFEFDERRLADADGDGFPTYQPRHCRDTDYLYMEARTYPSYFPRNAHARSGDTGNQQAIPYMTRTPANVLVFVQPNRFQIVCAGLDGEFFNPAVKAWQLTGTNYTPKEFPSGVQYHPADMDNLTNFAEGKTLGDARPQ